MAVRMREEMWFYNQIFAVLIFSLVFLSAQSKRKYKHKKKDAVSNGEHSECQQALGMESGDILDSQLSASSEGQWTLDGEPFLMSASNGRLNNDGLASCWESATNDEHQWLQVHLGEYYVNVTRIATQGCGREEEWVTSYKLQYSNDGVNFQYYMEKGQNTEK
ncbi:unnamed protein product, partial [Porites evermanni]